MQISELGEFSLIDRLKSIVAVDHPEIIVGIGDDVAVLAAEEGSYLLATVDAQVEGVHFLREHIQPEQLGRRALAINLSDIAAMGGSAQFVLVSLALPPEIEVEWVEALYRGLRAEAERAGSMIIGGNMARSPGGIFIDVTVIGRVAPHHLLLRSGATPGDLVVVTGQLGESAAGFHLLQNPSLFVAEPERKRLLQRHLTPTPRLAEAAIIARAGVATAMLDLSDGLGGDIGHICDRSGVGVRLFADRLPIPTGVRGVASQRDIPAWQLALSGGEDYELCFTVPVDQAGPLIRFLEQESGTPAAIVGEILPAEQGRWLQLPDGSDLPLTAGGWEHFGKES